MGYGFSSGPGLRVVETVSIEVADESAMQALGQCIGRWLVDKYRISTQSARPAAAIAPGSSGAPVSPTAGPLLVTLSGELGAGKSVLARAIIHSWGYTGSVKSPTYTLVETYDTPQGLIAHLDLYRLVGDDELEYLGVDDLWRAAQVVLVEWPERAAGALPEPALALALAYAQPGRVVRLTEPAHLPGHRSVVDELHRSG